MGAFVKPSIPVSRKFAPFFRDLWPCTALKPTITAVVLRYRLRYAGFMAQDMLNQWQQFGLDLLPLLQNQWLLLSLGSLFFAFIVRILLGPVRGQEMAGFSLAPVLCGLMVIIIGQTLFMEPAPGNSWAFAWDWRVEQMILLFSMIGWALGLILDILRRPFLLAIVFGLFAALAFSLAFVVQLRAIDATLPEMFSKTVAFGLVSAFIIWRYAQSENGPSVLRMAQLGTASLGLFVVSLVLQYEGLLAIHSAIFAMVFIPGFLIAWLLWTSVGRGSNLGAVGLFGGLSPFLLFLGYLVFVVEALSLTATALLVLILIGPDLMSGFERRRRVSDRVPFLSGLFYLVSIFVLYVALIFTAGLDARS